MDWIIAAPKKGDIIRVKVRFYHHYGLFVSDEEAIQFGARDNAGTDPKEIAVITTDIDGFAEGAQVETARLTSTEKRSRRSPAAAVNYARAQLGRTGYDILHNNCEHFVNECVFGKPHSAFVENVRKSLREKLR